jgi:hypothetical protein
MTVTNFICQHLQSVEAGNISGSDIHEFGVWLLHILGGIFYAGLGYPQTAVNKKYRLSMQY